MALPKEARAGGLAAAMDAALSETGGLWFGWSGRIAPAGARDLRQQREGAIDYALLDLTRAEYDDYYLGFSNRTLWPLLHFQPNLIDYHREHHAAYLEVNRLFAQKLAPLLRAEDRIWIHDYHLVPLGAELRKLGVGNRLGFFLHVPLPPAQLLATLPGHEELFSAFGAYDLVGLQTRDDVRALHDYLREELGAAIGAKGRVTMRDGRSFRVAAFPISVDADRIARQAATAVRSAASERLRGSLEGRALAIGIDRLDYSKGLPKRFEAFGRFLQTHAHWRAKVSLLQIAPPSRQEVPEYRELRTRLERMAGAINGRYAEPDWVPIRYVNRSFRHATLAGFCRMARLALVTPLRDGMNLVAKEYIAAQAPQDPGVLVLSHFAGAARELDSALRVNPYDADELVSAIARGLTMPLHERRERWHAMFAHLQKHDITAWRKSFLAALEDA
ncbi:MAG TPA: trehalose-6-phosphate synthase [Rhodanobacteraceae bacterium]|nr:trehalose-6-phosphate synthase [Rhodanobacteraceae bacterium]